LMPPNGRIIVHTMRRSSVSMTVEKKRHTLTNTFAKICTLAGLLS
jgi:hypothetical protein